MGGDDVILETVKTGKTGWGGGGTEGSTVDAVQDASN